MKKHILLILSLLLISLVTASYYLKPTMPFLQFTSIKNETFSSKDLNNYIVILHFWSITCPSCIEEMPELIKIQDHLLQKKVKIIAIAMYYDQPHFVLNYVNLHRIPFPVVVDYDNKIAKAFGEINAVPTSFLIDKNGKIIKKWIGPLHKEEIENTVNTLISGE